MLFVDIVRMAQFIIVHVYTVTVRMTIFKRSIQGVRESIGSKLQKQSACFYVCALVLQFILYTK